MGSSLFHWGQDGGSKNVLIALGEEKSFTDGGGESWKVGVGNGPVICEQALSKYTLSLVLHILQLT